MSPPLWRAFSHQKRIPATLRTDERRGVVVDWGNAHGGERIADPHLIRSENLPMEGAILFRDGRCVFATSAEADEIERTEAASAQHDVRERAAREAHERELRIEAGRRRRAINEALALPFPWHPGYKPTLVGCYEGPKTNGSGATAATVSHVVVETSIEIGRLKRAAGTILCGARPGTNGACGLTAESLESTTITCRGCTTIIDRIKNKTRKATADG